MKKTYTKPMIAFEDMKLNSAIAAGACTIYYVADCTEQTCPDGEGTDIPVYIPSSKDNYWDSDFHFCSSGSFYCYHVSIQGLVDEGRLTFISGS